MGQTTRTIYLHVGLPKTGTSFWAARVFSKIEGMVLLHARNGLAVSNKLGRLLKGSATPDPDQILEASNIFRDVMGAHAGDIILANENITIQRSGFWLNKGSAPRNLVGHLLALRECLTDVDLKVILGTRRQDLWFASRYAQSGRSIDGAGQADFDRRIAEISTRPSLDGPVEWLLYDHAAKVLRDGLGQDSLMILPLEDLETAPEQLVLSLGQFLGERDLSELAQKMSRRGEFSKKKNQRRLAAMEWKLSGGAGTIVMSDSQSRAILDRFTNQGS